VKPDFIKTSTGFGTGGATASHVAIMKQNCGSDVQVKASGGIRSWSEAKAMLEAGATRLGVSAGMKIIEELKASEE
jgi:deoxyribose-phosphate aldolase